MPRSGLVEREPLSYGGEQVPYILSGLGRRLEEEEAGFAGIGLSVGGGDGALVGLFRDEIQLVAGQGDDYVLVGLALQLLDPGLCLIQGRLAFG